MQKTLTEFMAQLGGTLSAEAWKLLTQYADLVWEKKEQLNLTSVADRAEIFKRHLADGLVAAALLQRRFGSAPVSAADMGSGAGYIGLTLAAVCPQVQVTLVESLQKRGMFLNWVILKLGLTNVSVKGVRLGQAEVGTFDFVTERAMGQLADILPLLAPCVKKGGLLAAFQSMRPSAADLPSVGLAVAEPVCYTLPGESKERYLTVFN